LSQTPESGGHLVPVAAESPRGQREERTLAFGPELRILLAHDFLTSIRVGIFELCFISPDLQRSLFFFCFFFKGAEISQTIDGYLIFVKEKKLQLIILTGAYFVI
jgi:hypothetical protein